MDKWWSNGLVIDLRYSQSLEVTIVPASHNYIVQILGAEPVVLTTTGPSFGYTPDITDEITPSKKGFGD